MKFYLVLAATLFGQSFGQSVDPCKPVESTTCKVGGSTCVEDKDCCSGLGCFGYNFFRRCQPPPNCLPEFYDCSSGMLCCGDLVCSENNSGKAECQKPKVDTRPVFLPGTSNLIETLAPTAAPKVVNTRTTPRGANIVGCVSGDPHITTFDGLQYDCMGHGEFIILRSRLTQRQIQGRFSQLEDRAVSSIVGIVIQDEGNVPKIQVTIPLVNDGFAQVLGDQGCKYQFFVDGVQRDLYRGSGSSAVDVTVSNNNQINVRYRASGMSVTISAGFWMGCLMNTCYTIPNGDSTLHGMVGSPDKNVNNDWMRRDGSLITVPTDRTLRVRQPAYDYCMQNWCIRNKSESLFTYNQLGLDFQDFMRCDLKFNAILDEDLTDLLTPDITAGCGDDLDCLIDAARGDLKGAKQAQTARLELQTTCNMAGGECSISSCCTGLTCEDRGFVGKVCVTAPSVCMPELGACDTKGCCEGLQCVTSANGMKVCQDIPGVCNAESRSCKDSDDCCNGLGCVGFDNDKRCKKVTKLANSVCLPQGETCGFGIDCCSGSTCVDDMVGGYRCLKMPSCWNEPMRPCEKIEGMPGCCPGFECVERTGRNVCSPLPTCQSKWLSCDKLPCCDSDGTNKLQCVTSTLDGVTRKLCQPVLPVAA